MKTQIMRNMKGSRIALAGLLTFAWMVHGPALSSADEAMEARQIVEKSKLTFDSFMANKELSSLRGLIRKAKGIFISPQVLKGAFIFGASGGSGVLVVRDPKTAQWNGPAFYTIGEASFGLQIGGEAAEVLLLAMTERGVTALLSHSVKLGADVGVAAGPVGAGVDASSANLSADILSYSLAKGLYGGVSIEGAVVGVRSSWNHAYYGKKVTPTDILIRRDAKNDHAKRLLGVISKAASPAGSGKTRK